MSDQIKSELEKQETSGLLLSVEPLTDSTKLSAHPSDDSMRMRRTLRMPGPIRRGRVKIQKTQQMPTEPTNQMTPKARMWTVPTQLITSVTTQTLPTPMALTPN